MKSAILEYVPATPGVQPPSDINVPESSRSECLIALAVFVLSFFYLCIFRKASSIDLDEGIILLGAQRILDGQVLYRDFFSFFTPGSYYLLALVFRIFGDSYLVAHTLVAFVGAGLSPLSYLLARRACGRQTSLLVTGVMTATAVPMRFIVLHNWDSTLLACLALYCAVRLLETTSSGWAFAAASFASLTVLFEQSKGAGLLLGLGLGFIIVALYGRQPNIFTRRLMVVVSLGLVWPIIVTFSYFGSQHALGEMLNSWFWPLRHYSAANHVPYGFSDLPEETSQALFHTGSQVSRLVTRLVFSSRLWIPFLPLFGVALLVRLTLRGSHRELSHQSWSYYVLLSSAMSGLLLSVVVARADVFHFVFLQPIFFLLLAWLLDGKNVRSAFFTRLAPVVGFCASISLLAMGLSLLFQVRPSDYVVSRRGTVGLSKRDAVLDYIQAHTSIGDSILVYPYQSTYYYLTQTYNPTRFDFCQPGMHSYEQLQEMRSEFASRPTKFVFYEPAYPDHIHDAWPNTPARDLARDPMADYIAKEYRACRTLTSANNWHFVAMVRKDLECP